MSLIDSLGVPTVYTDCLRLNNNKTFIVVQFIIDNHRHHSEIYIGEIWAGFFTL
jgi:hypothetical protein